MLPKGSKVFCLECYWRGSMRDLLDAPHPFDNEDTVYGCPSCRVLGFQWACDEPDCWDVVHCGTPTPSGYRRTCSKHRPEDPETVKATSQVDS